MPVRSNDPKYLAILALASLSILAVGAFIRPGGQPETTPASVTADLLSLEHISQRREVENIADFFFHVASQVEESVVLLGATGHSGVVWQASEVVTSARLGPFPSRDRTALGSREVELTTLAAAPNLPFVLLQAPREAVVSDRTPVRLYGHGSWLLAVWRSQDGSLRYSAGNLFGIVARRCGETELDEIQTNLDLRSIQPGAGVFSLDGGLLAVALDCAGTLIAAEAGALELQAHSEKTMEDQIIERYGMRAAQADEAEREFFGRGAGVVIRELWWGYRAHQAGLMPGDFVLAVDGVPVNSAEDLRPLLLPISREVHDLRVWRAKRSRTVRLLARAATEAAASTHGFVGKEGGLIVESVIRGTFAERAGARPGDRLLAVNQEPPESFEDLAAALRKGNGDPTYVALERRGRIWGTLVQANE